jgi:hypothetical protein
MMADAGAPQVIADLLVTEPCGGQPEGPTTVTQAALNFPSKRAARLEGQGVAAPSIE